MEAIYLHGSVCFLCVLCIARSVLLSFFRYEWYTLNARASYKCKHCQFMSSFFSLAFSFFLSLWKFLLCFLFSFPVILSVSVVLPFSVFIYLTTTTKTMKKWSFFVVLHFKWHFEIVIEPFGNGFLSHVLYVRSIESNDTWMIYKTLLRLLFVEWNQHMWARWRPMYKRLCPIKSKRKSFLYLTQLNWTDQAE